MRANSSLSFKARYPVDQWEKLFFTEDFLKEINEHWLWFDPPAEASFYALAVLYIVIMLIGVVGNGLVIYLFFRSKALRTPANVLILNLAISDLMLMSKMPIFIFNSFHKGPVLGKFGTSWLKNTFPIDRSASACRLYGFVGGLTGTVSICTLTAISLDRFSVIKHPLSRAFTGLRVKISLTITWLYGFVFSLIPLLDLGLGKYSPEGYLTSCSYDYLTEDTNSKYFILIFFLAAWFLPFILITYSYINILILVRSRKSINKAERESFRHVKKENERKQDIKLATTCFLAIALWFLAWTPYAIVSILGITNNHQLITPISSMVPALFCKIASAIDPYIYAISHPKFRSDIKSIFCAEGNKSYRIWFVSSDKTKSFPEQVSEIEEEMVEVDLGAEMAVYESNEMKDFVFERKRSVGDLICLRPSFSNRRSSLRKMARRISVLEKQMK